MSTVERLRRLGKLGATASFGVAVFLIVFDLTLPYARFKDLMASELSSYGYDLEARYAGPAFGLGMTLKDIAVVSRVSGGKATRILIDKAKIGVSLLSYLFGHRAVGLTADVFAGRVAADVDMGKSDSGFTIEVAQIDLAEIPWLKNAINLPASGRLDVKLNLALPKQHLRESKGLLRWECNSCAIGDGKAKLVVASNPILAEGLGLPKIRLGDFSGKVVIDKGVGRLQGVELKSPDVEATIEGEIHLVQPAVASHVDLYVRFRLSDSLLRSSEKLKTIMEFTTQMGKRPDGFIGFRVAGTLANLSNVEWMKSSPFANVPVPGKPAVRSSLPVPRPPLAAAAPARVPADPPPVAAIPPVTVAPPPPPAAPDSGPCAGGDHCPGARGAVSTASTARGARARPRAVRGSVGSVAGRGANLCPRSGQCPGCCRRTHLIPVSGCGRGRDPGRRAGRSPSRRGRAWGRSVPATTPRSAARPAGLRGRRSYSDLRPVRQGLPGAFCAPSTVARSCLRAVARPVAARRPIVYRRARLFSVAGSPEEQPSGARKRVTGLYPQGAILWPP